MDNDARNRHYKQLSSWKHADRWSLACALLLSTFWALLVLVATESCMRWQEALHGCGCSATIYLSRLAAASTRHRLGTWTTSRGTSARAALRERRNWAPFHICIKKADCACNKVTYGEECWREKCTVLTCMVCRQIENKFKDELVLVELCTYAQAGAYVFEGIQVLLSYRQHGPVLP